MKKVLGVADKNPKSFGDRLASFDKELAYTHERVGILGPSGEETPLKRP